MRADELCEVCRLPYVCRACGAVSHGRDWMACGYHHTRQHGFVTTESRGVSDGAIYAVMLALCSQANGESLKDVQRAFAAAWRVLERA